MYNKVKDLQLAVQVVSFRGWPEEKGPGRAMVRGEKRRSVW